MTSASPRRITVCADDYGIAPGVNRAIRHLIAQRRINASSVMVVAPSLPAAEATALKEAAGNTAALGLHITLTGPYQPLSHGYAPLRHGTFLSLASTLHRSHLRLLKPELLTIEIMRQIEAFDHAFGRPPDFVDGHQHVHLFPQVREAFLQVVKEALPRAWVRQCGRVVLPPRKRYGDRKALLLDSLSHRFRVLAHHLGVPTNPAFAGTYSFRKSADFTRLFSSFLDSLPDGGLIMCHPGIVDAELRRLDPLVGLREREYTFFSSAAFADLLTEHRVVLDARNG